MASAVNKNEIIRQFLKFPLSKKLFDNFFKICYQETLCYLSYLKMKGYRFFDSEADEKKAISDFAYDILGDFLRSSSNRPYFIILDYFKRHGIEDFDKIHSEIIGEHFSILLRGFIKRHISKLTNQDDPQTANLKLRFKDILSGDKYHSFKLPAGDNAVSSKSNMDNLLSDKSDLTGDDLYYIVEEAFLISNNRSQWCQNIFKLINKNDSYQNYIKRNDLISTVIKINYVYVEIETALPSKIPGPEYVYLKKGALLARTDAIKWASDNVILDFINKKRITDAESAFFLRMLSEYLSDLVNSGETDPIPVYFREIMPKEKHDVYLNKYKYILETIISRTVNYFREKLQ